MNMNKSSSFDIFHSIFRRSSIVRKIYQSTSTFLRDNPQNESSSSSKPLHDTFGRFHNYLRMSLTEKCNLRCIYCMPMEGVTLTPRPELLSLDERKLVISLFARLGVNKIRFTGGEPTISNQLIHLVRHAKYSGMKSIGITTNGLELGRNRQRINDLVDAGVSSINISLDSLQSHRFATISRRDKSNLMHVLSAIHYASSLESLHVKINCVLMKGVNDDELTDFAQLTKDMNIDCRFIEVMPFDGNEWSPSKLMNYREALVSLRKAMNVVDDKDESDPHDTTKWFRIIDDSGSPNMGRVGFITSMSSNFCKGCNRLRVTADGKLKVCLFGDEGLSLIQHLRDGTTDDALIQMISDAVKRKKETLGGHENPENIAAAQNRPMILIGG